MGSLPRDQIESWFKEVYRGRLWAEVYLEQRQEYATRVGILHMDPFAVSVAELMGTHGAD